MQNYLQQILTESNTIIIPGFGALTITSTKTGDIYFMPFLKHDDGQLAKYIAKVEAIELEEAKNTIADFINTIQSSLKKGENFEMTEFGRFKINNEGEIEFQRWEDYQIKDTTILSKKVKERKISKEKLKTIVPENMSIEQPLQNDVLNKSEEPIKTDKELHQQIEEELPLSSNPIHLSIEETIIHSIEETIIDNKSINELLIETENDNVSLEKIQNNESDTTHNEFITLIEESSLETNETYAEDEIMETSDIKNQTHATTENSLKTIIQSKEDKKALRKKLKNERDAAKAAEKRLKKGFRPEDKEIVPTKDKKKSRSMILWLFSAILITLGTMWYIKKQRDNKVHLTVIDKNQSKIITNKVIEKKELHKELSKHSAKKVEEKENSSTKMKEITNETNIIIPVDNKPKTDNQNNSNLTTIDSKSLTPSNTSTKLNTVNTNIKTENTSSQNTKTTAPVKINSVIISSTPIITPIPAPQKTKVINPNPAYTSPDKNIQVIVGTFKDKASADQLLTNLKTDGFSAAYSRETNGTYQVSLGSFTTLSESNKALQKYRGVTK